MVSIIVPVYNVRDYLDRCMQSILNQTFKDIEVILINDGSTDGSDELCLEWQKKDKRIIYISKQNEGLGPTRNVGVSIAKGEYINFVDSDDWIEEDAIESMYTAAEKSNADIVLSDINYVTKGEDGSLNVSVSKLRIDSEVPIDSSIDIRFIDKARLTAWGKLYRRDFYIDSEIMQPAHAFEDAAVIPLLVAKSNIIYHVPKPLYNYYRGRKDSIVNDFSCYTDLRKTFEDEKRSFNEAGLFDKYYEALKKIDYAQVRFMYKKLLGEGKEIEPQNMYVLNELYSFMDSVYPDWVKIDTYNIGVLGNINLKNAIVKTVFNNSRISYSDKVSKEVLNTDILVIELTNDLFYSDSVKWKEICRENMNIITKEFTGKKIIAVKFIDNDNYSEEMMSSLNEVYELYKDNDCNVNILEFEVNRDMFDENLEWDLSDEILKKLNSLGM